MRFSRADSRSSVRGSFASQRAALVVFAVLLVLYADVARSSSGSSDAVRHLTSRLRSRSLDGLARDNAAAVGQRVLLLTTWTVLDGALPAAPTRAQCAAAFAGARVLLGTVAARGAPARGTDTVVVHNTPCTTFVDEDKASEADTLSSTAGGGVSVSGVSVPMRAHGRFHVFDERWLWYAAVLEAARQAGTKAAAAAAATAARLSDAAALESTPRDAWNATPPSTLSGPFWTSRLFPPVTHALVMDARDAELLAPPAAFFAAHPNGDLFAGEECTPVGGNPWMLERYEPCAIDYAPYAEQQIINAGVVGGRARALEWLAGEIVLALLSAEARAGRGCT
jgi:hypothetical protein